MKKHLVLLLLAISFQGFAQTNLITGINISLPANPDANIAEWSKSMPPLMISAQTRMENGRVSPMVMESSILVSIKGSGAVCGSYSKANAPASNFNSPAKVWSGEAALNLLGKACVLKPGNYEFCVQFFADGAVGQVLIGEACKSFTIKETEHKSYQPPQALAPVNGTELSDDELKKPTTFRWTPIIPKPQEPVTYRLKVWQLMQGQTGTQAMQVNQPIIEKDVDNMTQTVINNIVDDPCKPPYLCDFVWNVQALNHEGKPIGENNGTSNPFQFSANSCDVNLALKLKSIECLQPTHGFNNYKVCITSTYSSSNYNLTYSGSNGIKAYAPSYSPYYTVSNITPALQVQNSGATTTVNYCFDVSVPTGQTSIKIGLQGDDKDPGPMVCQPGAELDLRLPNCTNPTCDCGTWSPLSVQTAAGAKRYDCGSEILWNCKIPFQFTSSYQCSPNDKTCQAKTKWEVRKDGNNFSSGNGSSGTFTPTANGTYTLTTYANCNGKECKPCITTFIVEDCIDEKPCDCGKWGDSAIKIQKGGTIISNVKCDGDVSLGIGTYGIQYPNFICNPNDKTCLVSYSWSVQGPITGNGTGQLINFNFSLAGTYTITLTPICGNKKCKPCIIVIKIEDPLPCNLSFTDNLKDSYCVGDQVTVNWTGTPQPSTVNLVLIDFTNWVVYQTLATNISNSGSYTLTLPSNLPCDPERKWCFYVTDPAQNPQCWNYSKEFIVGCCSVKPCDCGTWSPLSVQTAAGAKRYDCGSEILWNCKIPFQFTSSYQCSPNDKTCETKTTWDIKKGAIVIKSGTGTNQLNDGFSLLENGTYILTLNASCNGKVCPPCTYKIVVKDCKPCDCGAWSTLLVNKVKYECGNEKPIKWTCNKPIEFSNTYQCSPNDEICQAKTKWEVKKDGQSFGSGNGSSGNFTPTANGTYTLILHADCNGKECRPCVTTFIVEDCVSCGCGEWSDFPITIQTGGAIISRIKCDGSASLGISTYSIQYPNFICSPNDKTCLASYLWSVQGPVSGNGIGNLINFNFSQTGTYTVTLTPICGGKKCKPCKIIIKIENPLPCNLSFLDNLKDSYCVGDQVTVNWTGTPQPSTVNLVLIDFTNWVVYQTLATNISNSGSYTLTLPSNLPCDPERKWCFYVTDPAQNPQCWNYSKEFTIGCCEEKPCDCGTWSKLTVQTAAGAKRYDCGSEILWNCKTPFQFASSYQCSPNDKTCVANTTWEVRKGNVVIKSGTGTNQLNDGFSLLENGTYTLTLNPSCNDKKCPPCIYTIVVKDCIPLSCECNNDMYIIVRPGELKIRCTESKIFDYGTKITLVPQNICNPAECLSEWNINVYDAQTGAYVTSGSGTGNNSFFDLSLNSYAGYRIELTGNCNGKKCKCEFWIRTKS